MLNPLLKWDAPGKRFFETGVDHGVLYQVDANGKYVNGVVWDGLTSVQESPSGAEATPLYADNIKYLNLMSAEEFAATIEAYTYPDEFMQNDGSAALVTGTGVYIGQQPRKPFGLCYRTKIGNDNDGNEHGYKLHLIYGCLASPSERAYNTVNDNPEAITFSWSVNTTPVEVANNKNTAILTIDSTKVKAEELEAFEQILYGTPGSTDPSTGTETDPIQPRMPLPNEVATMFTALQPEAGE